MKNTTKDDREVVSQRAEYHEGVNFRVQKWLHVFVSNEPTRVQILKA